MLSTENPPPDPPCPSEILQLKSCSSNISSDERASDNNLHQLEVDLFKSGLDDNNPLPKFSIRDYVFNTRGKDIKTHWPFSPKNLQLCLKHGVKDVLPPFQTLESVRNPSIVKCAAENISNSVVKLSGLSDHLLSASSNNVGQKLALDIENIKSSSSEEDKEYPSTTTSLSCSDVNSVPLIKSPCLEPEAENLPGSLSEKPEFAVPASNKVESNTQNPVKKCRLIVKLSNITEPKSNEELSFNTSPVSETMASKVCPVCKTFTSSSNTTLNAHIDQCLSGESTIKWTTNSKVIKHRIKPRKTRLMADIYATALCCTLEDLDRRNGTNWASNLGFPAQDLELYAKEKNNTYSSVNTENNNDEGAVYFDSNGTKLRILSKFIDLQSNSNAKDDCGPTKLVKRDKGSKLVSSKKKKHLVQKHKFLKCPPYGQRNCSPRPDDCPEVNNGQERKFPPEAYDKEDLAQPLKPCEQMKSNDFGMIKKWVGSKRTGLKKKINPEHESQHPVKIVKNLRVKSNLPSLSDKFIKRTRDLSFPILSDDNPLLAIESHKRKEILSFNSHDEYIEQPCLRKRAGISLMESRDCHRKKNHLILSKCNVKQSKNGPPVHKHCTDSPNGNDASSRSDKKMRSISPTINADSSFISSRMSQPHIFSSGAKEFGSLKKTSLDHAVLSGGKKLSSLRKNLLSVRHASVSESKKNLGRKHLDFKKRRLHYTSGSDEEAVDRSAIHRQDNLVETLGENAAQMEKASGKSLIDRVRVLKIRKRRGGFVNTGKEGDMASKGSDASPESHSHGVERNIDSFVGGNVPSGTSNVLDVVKEVEIHDEFVCEQISKISGGEALIGFGESLGSGFPALTGPDVELVSQCPADLVLGGEQEMFCADKVGKDLVTSSTHVVAEINANEGQGNYFVDVDPIPIPGPPGSFLPSPGRMASEELQGNSSLTSCRIHSSEDEHEMIDMDSSDSPISAMSFVSNSIAARSDSVSFVHLPLKSHGVQLESQRDISEDRMDLVVESSIPFEQAAGADGKPKHDESISNLMPPEMGPHRFKKSQPCCCSRKEGVLQSGSLNYQESQLLRRRTMTSFPPLPSQEKQIGHDPNNKLYSFNLRSETVPEKEPTPEPEKVVANSQNGYAVLVSHSSAAKYPTCGDCESPGPSTSNPVLRLMGKNLMVVNKEENLSPQTRLTQSSMVNDHPGLLSCVDNVVSSGNIQNEHHLFHRTLSRGPSIFDNTQTCTPLQHSDFTSSDGCRIHGNFRIPELSPHPSRIMLSSKSFGGGFTSSLECHEYAGGYNFTPDQLGSKIRLDTPIRHKVEKVRTPVPQLRTADYSGDKHKEIIVIDDSPENEASLAIKATYGENMEAGGSSVRISESKALRYDSRHVNPFYGYQTRCYPICSGSQMVQNANTQVQPSKGMNENLVNWNRTPESSSVLHPNSLTASSPSTGHLRSSLYFSPGFSLPTNFT
ncbi:hypothetical protein Pfo_023024 [Paulownia fortunei]|nr:hypothetical protein Pfo_023024 [Paulownia fortunei]